MTDSNRASTTLLLVCLAIAACSTSLLAGWIPLGPELPGRINAVLVHPTNPLYRMAGASGGGVWVSTSTTSGWALARNLGLEDFHVRHLAWDRTHGERIYASTRSDLYASIDFGGTWSNLTGTRSPAPLTSGGEYKGFAHLAGAEGQVVLWAKPCSGLFYSLDGAKFVQHFPFTGGTSNPDNCVSAIAADDVSGRVYIALAEATYGNRIYRTRCSWWDTDPCTSWEPMSDGLPEHGRVVELTWRGTAHRLAAVLESPTRVVTSDGGEPWCATDGALPTASWAPRTLIAPSEHQLILGAVIGYQTTDGGETWSSVWADELHPDVRGIYWDEPRRKLWFATDGHTIGTAGVFGTFDFIPGQAPTNPFVFVTPGLSTWQPYVTTLAGISQPGYKRRLFSGSQDNGLLCSDNLGLNWEAIQDGTGCGDNFALAIAPSDPDHGYVRSCDGEVLGRTFNARSAAVCEDVVWSTVRPRIQPAIHRASRLEAPAVWTPASIAIYPTDPDLVAFATGDTVSVSSDGGRIWSSSPSLGAGAVSVAFLPPGQLVFTRELLVGTAGGGIFYSSDGGANFRPFGLQQAPPAVVFKIEVVPASGQSPLTVFAATTDGLYRKVGRGDFVRVHGAPGRTVSDVEADPSCPWRIYVAHGYAGHRGMHGGGVEISEDSGASFRSLTGALPLRFTAIPDIEIDPLESRFLYVSTFGQGSWRYDAENLLSCLVLDP